MATQRKSRAEVPPYQPHIGESRQYWRDIILGVNDGLVSMMLLVVGVVGGGLSTRQVLLTGLAGALAGAVSMAAGEFLATKSQDEVLEAEMQLERQHITHHRGLEVRQLRGFFADMGVAPEDLDQVVAAFERSDETLLNAMKALEFGFVDSERRSPYMAMLASGGLFLVGSLPSVVPFGFALEPLVAMTWAAGLSLIGLFLVGVVKARVTRGNWVKSGLENMGIAGVGGALAWTIGRLIGASL